MLAVLLTIFMFSQGLSLEDQGRTFITAFPENIAYFHQKVLNYLKITCLLDYTEVTITYVGEVDEGISTRRVLDKAGVTWTWSLTKEVEVSQFKTSNKSILISSNQNVTVLSMSGWPGRFLSHVVQPIGNLGTVYHVPTLNYTKLVASFDLMLNPDTRYNSFRLLIINAANQSNKVTIKQVNKQGGRSEFNQTLDKYNLFQLPTYGEVTEINATEKIAVMFTHPCFDSRSCSCNMVLNQLRPTKLVNLSSRFYIPFHASYPTTSIKQLFLTTNQLNISVVNGTFQNAGFEVNVINSTDILPLLPGFNKPSQLITISKTVSLTLISPGLILDLIPESLFAGCYLVHFNSLNSEALVLAQTSSTDSVRMNAAGLPHTTKWTVVNGTRFSWTIVRGNAADTSATIWHTDSMIGVYVIEKLEYNIYGRAAIVLSDEPDPKGCVVTPGTFVIGDEELNWFWSRKYCQVHSDHFARPFHEQFQNKMVLNITVPTPVEGWISLRRDLLTREWYWRSEDNFSPQVNFTYWEQGQPDVPEKGLCASVSLDPAKTFKWKSARCCSKKKPVCYNNPKYLML
ncbi:uncharacterized protein LOC130558079 [Triplophysa rosa]|uniref:C-type lectin domain-containing protein n=1 Tax=Triplophysa rosa TaxID=992332 RepID=A0A9W8C4D5_TRIRA|nr:uncharacterized protein LOC130558079 [Triplophysa rosa]KAI7806938.1 hypothetical protein IRJ41_014515 [Triplophysa rosa]